jgi:hypothetical protein
VQRNVITFIALNFILGVGGARVVRIGVAATTRATAMILPTVIVQTPVCDHRGLNNEVVGKRARMLTRLTGCVFQCERRGAGRFRSRLCSGALANGNSLASRTHQRQQVARTRALMPCDPCRLCVSLFDVCCQLIHQVCVRERGLTINGTMMKAVGTPTVIGSLAGNVCLSASSSWRSSSAFVGFSSKLCRVGITFTYFSLPSSAGRLVGSRKPIISLATTACC